MHAMRYHANSCSRAFRVSRGRGRALTESHLDLRRDMEEDRIAPSPATRRPVCNVCLIKRLSVCLPAL